MSGGGGTASPAGAIHVSLEVFEGPLDLLLSLIERKGLEVTAVSVVAVAGQYIEQIRAWQEMDLAVTAEFLAMAARLLLLKSRALLPRPPQDPAETGPDEGDADARDLADRLTLYKAFAGVAAQLRDWQEEGRASYGRSEVGALPDYLASPPLDGAAEQAALLRAAVRCLKRAQRRAAAAPRSVPPSPLDLDFRAVLAEVARRVALGPAAGQPFEALLPDEAPVLLVVATFLALLELVRQSVARLVQERPCGPLLVRAVAAAPAGAAGAGDG